MTKKVKETLKNENGASNIEVLLIGGFSLVVIPLLAFGLYFLLNMDADTGKKLETIKEEQVIKFSEDNDKKTKTMSETGE